MKIKVNNENFERFIVDYYDGQLSPEEEQALLRFLERYPELKEAFDRFAEAPVLEKEETVFPEKAALKQPEIKPAGAINEENHPEYFVLEQDGELPEKAQRQLQLFLAENPFLKGEYERFAQARLSPDETIVFENKAQLKKRAAGLWLPYAGVAAAAVLLFFGLRFLFPGAGNPETSRPASVVRPLAEKTVETTVAAKADHKIKMLPAQLEKHNAARRKNHKPAPKPVIPMRHYKPVKMLASATIYPEINRQEDYFPLLFPKASVWQENLTLSSPVVVEKPVRSGFLRNTIGKPFSQLAAVLAVQKRKRRISGSTRDKGFVKVLEGGVTALNVLTDQDLVMVKTYDANGNLIDYQLLSDNFSINRPVKEGR